MSRAREPDEPRRPDRIHSDLPPGCASCLWEVLFWFVPCALFAGLAALLRSGLVGATLVGAWLVAVLVLLSAVRRAHRRRRCRRG